ncbi:hypothetical protein FDUTEX481_04951 [Tolypothrix sp. PCC 7601]|nr:hypothetical protein FDUTEX481_04951 [Tolypothrix sp. PCC 7601]
MKINSVWKMGMGHGTLGRQIFMLGDEIFFIGSALQKIFSRGEQLFAPRLFLEMFRSD